MLVSNKEFVESLAYMEISTVQMLEFISTSLDGLGPIDLWKNSYANVLAIHHRKKELFSIQKYDQESINVIVGSGDYMAVTVQNLIKPMLQ